MQNPRLFVLYLGASCAALLGQSLPSGSANALLIDPANSKMVYAATNGGVYKSLDGGLNWTLSGLPINGQLGSIVNALAFDPTNSSTIYAASLDGVFKTVDASQSWKQTPLPFGCSSSLAVFSPITMYAGTCGQGVYRSSDGGQTWVAANAGIQNQAVTSLAADPAHAGAIYAGTSTNGVFKSIDAGQSWLPASSGLTGGVFSLVFDPGNPGSLWAGTSYGAFNSVDGGQTWSSSSVGLPVFTTVRNITFDPYSPKAIYLGGSRGGGLFKSTDGGLSWSASYSGLPAIFSSGVMSVAADRFSPCTLFAATLTDSIYKSTDCANTWFADNHGITALDIYAVAVDPAAPSTLYAGAHGAGIFQSRDAGLTWSVISAYSGSGLIWQIVQDPSQTNRLYVADDDGIFETEDSGRTWFTGDQMGSFSLTTDPANPSTVYAGSYNGTILKSINAGHSWTPYQSGLPASYSYGLAVDPGNSALVYTATLGSGVYKSLDGGVDWAAANSGLTWPYLEALSFDQNKPATLYAGSTFGLFKSPNGGQSWSQVAGLPISFITSLAFDPSNASTIYVGGYGGVAKTIDGGATWTRQNVGFQTLYAERLTIDPANPSVIYAGLVGGGIYKSTNAGASWLPAAQSGGLACTYSISPPGQGFTAQGGLGSFVVNTQPTCNWRIFPSAGWITILPSGFKGTATVNYSIGANGTTARTGTISVGGQNYNIDQTAIECTYSVSPAVASFNANGGDSRIVVNSPAACSWTANSNTAWLSVTAGAAGSGNGAISVHAAPNTGAARSGTVTIAGRSFSVTQSASGSSACGAIDVSSQANVERSGFTPIFFTSYDYRQTLDVIPNSFIKGPVYMVLVGEPTYGAYPHEIGLIGGGSTSSCFSSPGDYILLISGEDLQPGQQVGYDLLWFTQSLGSFIGYSTKLLSGLPSH